MPESPACRVCTSTRLEPFLDLGMQPLCNNFMTQDAIDSTGEPRYPLVLFMCRDCSLVQLSEGAPAADMFSDHLYLTGTTRALVEHFAALAADLDARYLRGGDLVVDIGSNDGTLLAQYDAAARRVLGIEACEPIARIAEGRGVPTRCAFLSTDTVRSVVAEHGKARLVTAAGVWFHLEDLHDATEAVKLLLDADGVFVVQAMYLGAVLDNDAYDSFYHEHLCLYSFTALENLLRRHGLEVFDVERAEIHGGSLTVHAGHPNVRPVATRVAALLEEERARGILDVATYHAFADRVAEKSNQLRRMLEEARQAGRRVWAYGAPAKSSTLLNYSRIGPDLVELALEVNALKCGRLTPGTHIPVVNEQDLDPGRRPDDMLLLTWNFRASLEPRVRALLPSGGRILLPIPAPRWI